MKMTKFPDMPDGLSILCIKREGKRKVLHRTITIELVVSTDDEYNDPEDIEECLVAVYCNKKPLYGFTESYPLTTGSLSGYLNDHIESSMRFVANLCFSESRHLTWSAKNKQGDARKSLTVFHRQWLHMAKSRLNLISKGRPRKFTETLIQEIRLEYRQLQSICSKIVKPYHDVVIECFWKNREIFWDLRKIRRRDLNLETWREEWLQHASRKFPDVPTDLLDLFSGSSSLSPSEATKTFLAKKYNTGPEYLEVLLTPKESRKKKDNSIKRGRSNIGQASDKKKIK